MDVPARPPSQLTRTRDGAPPAPQRRFPLLLGAAALLGFGLAAAGVWYALQPTVLRIAVGPEGSDDAKVVLALSHIFARERHALRLKPVVTDGAAASLGLLAQDKADLAIARADLDLMPSDAESVAVMRKNFVVLWAPTGAAAKSLPKEASKETAKETPKEGRKEAGKAQSKVKALEDLPGHRLGIVGRTPANVVLLKVILRESGIDPDKVDLVQYPVTSLADMAKDASLAAYMAVGPLGSRITAEAIAATAKVRGEPKFLGIDVGDAIAQKHPLYESEEIPANTFSALPPRPDDKVDSVSVDHLIVARHGLSEGAVAAFARQLFSVNQALQRDMPGMAKIQTPDTDKAAALPAHRGAAAFVDGTERTFLDKYSDMLWFGLFLASGIGSAYAWMRSYLRKNEIAENAGLRARLLDMIPEARDAPSQAVLDALRVEADGVLRETLDCFDDKLVEEDALAAFGLAFAQFNQAATDAAARLAQGTGVPMPGLVPEVAKING